MYIDSELYERYLSIIEEESREHSEDGTIAYPYVSGVLSAQLKAMATSEIMHKVVLQVIKDKVSEYE